MSPLKGSGWSRLCCAFLTVLMRLPGLEGIRPKNVIRLRSWQDFARKLLWVTKPRGEWEGVKLGPSENFRYRLPRWLKSLRGSASEALTSEIPSATQTKERRMEKVGWFKILLPVEAKVEENLVRAISAQSVLENALASHWLVRFIEDMITQRWSERHWKS